MVSVPLLVLTGRVAAAPLERVAELFALRVIEKVDAFIAEVPPLREEPR
jgi:hypothetical protein